MKNSGCEGRFVVEQTFLPAAAGEGEGVLFIQTGPVLLERVVAVRPSKEAICSELQRSEEADFRQD